MAAHGAACPQVSVTGIRSIPASVIGPGRSARSDRCSASASAHPTFCIAAVSRNSTLLKVHPDGTGALKKNGKHSIGQSSGGWTSKRHLVAAAARTVVACCVSPGDYHDAPDGRVGMQPIGPVKQPRALLMDRAFEDDDTQRQAQRFGYQPVFPAKFKRRSPWQSDGLLYRRRYDIERLLRCRKGGIDLSLHGSIR